MRSPNAAPASRPCRRRCASRRCGEPMPSYRYRAMNGSGELVSGAMAGQSASEVSRRIETLGLVLVETLTVEDAAPPRSFGLFNQPRAEDVTVFTRDLGLLLRAGARVISGLELFPKILAVAPLRPSGP